MLFVFVQTWVLILLIFKNSSPRDFISYNTHWVPLGGVLMLLLIKFEEFGVPILFEKLEIDTGSIFKLDNTVELMENMTEGWNCLSLTIDKDFGVLRIFGQVKIEETWVALLGINITLFADNSLS